MAVQVPKTGFEKWQDGINKAVNNAKWNAWDCEIQRAVNEYNQHLSGTPGYRRLDWQLIKAMIWVETGAHTSDWNFRPMQIGMAGDPGLKALLSGNEGGDLILPPAWKGRLTMESARVNPAHNIRAGIGYLLMRMANIKYQSMPGADARVYEITVKPGDSLDKIARVQGSTVDTLKKLNPTATVLRPGQVLKYQKASIQRVIVGWKDFSTRTIALYYNSMQSDPNYVRKIDYALFVVRKGKASPCTQ